jgi:hypothetical protein
LNPIRQFASLSSRRTISSKNCAQLIELNKKKAEISTPISTPISHSKSRSKAHPISNQRQLQSPFVSPKGSVDDNCKSPSPSSPIFQSPPHSTKLLRTRSLGLISSLEKDILDSPNFFVMYSISPPKTPLYTPSNKNNLIIHPSPECNHVSPSTFFGENGTISPPRTPLLKVGTRSNGFSQLIFSPPCDLPSSKSKASIGLIAKENLANLAFQHGLAPVCNKQVGEVAPDMEQFIRKWSRPNCAASPETPEMPSLNTTKLIRPASQSKPATHIVLLSPDPVSPKFPD